MDTVFLLQHVRGFGDGHEDVKLIGVFSSEDKARAALDQLKRQPGFRESISGFQVSQHAIDQVGWGEGFVTIDPGED